MIKKVLSYIKKYQMIKPDDTIIAGISGGADSVCLFFMMLEIQKLIPFNLEVVHINHGIRSDAGQDADFVKALCEKHGIRFYLVEKNISELAKTLGISEEEAGRKVRYEAFEQTLGGRAGRIAVAHNANDRAETMLFHLFRGTGLAGASGIRPINGRIIRPLLCVSRQEIENWLEARTITFCTDSTNQQDIYTRNKIRHHILPYAENEICKGAIGNMNRAADQLLEAEEFTARLTATALEKCVDLTNLPESLTIHLPQFFLQDVFLQNRILLSCIEKMAGGRKDITAEHIHLIRELFLGTGSKELHLPYDLTVYKKYDLGMIQMNSFPKEASVPTAEYELDIPLKLDIPLLGRVETTVFPYKNSVNIPEKTYTKWFDYDKITWSVVIRTRKSGDYLTINKEMARKSVQDYFVNEKIPKSERDSLFLLAEESHILWIPGYRISEYYKIDSHTKNILQVTINLSE